ncbi:hypothetical protein [Dethiobacter alkaliphilus]|uniref:Uncharacterized protein n=1 Tax=Dethiobacter alkaliphilus AHT 1 TaxID=555088 RepID=C0GIN7_DETAL|nr:hypothetical protein [Dethiobacter alkaliphilus]EEG76701.1 hypothetical protein DealDRAFT_2346 [Dethiobacter alkaliphilus AHT 1]MCW3490913.1 hypothetical protein [Dethiobacter alkaliphilus]
MFIFGYRLMVWIGLLAALFIFAAVAAVYLGRRHKWLLKGRWHHRLALAGAFFAAIHVVLAVLQVFFGIFV